MSQVIDPLPNNENNRVLCCYVNNTGRIQVARITNIQNWYFERVVFPQQRLVFEAIPQALLEIHSGMMASSILSDTIPCERLCVEEAKDLPRHSSVLDIYSQDDIESSTNDSAEVSDSKTTVNV